MLDVLTALVVLAVLAVLFVAAVVATHESDILRDAPADAPDPGLPAGPVQPEDVAEVRFGLAVRGYRMSEVDEVLARLAHELAARDSRILRLEKALVEVVEPALEDVEEQLATPPTVAEQAGGEEPWRPEIDWSATGAAAILPVSAGLSEGVTDADAEVDAGAEVDAEVAAFAPAVWESDETELDALAAAETEPEAFGSPSFQPEPQHVHAPLPDAFAEGSDDFPELYLPDPAPVDLPDATDDAMAEAPALHAFHAEEAGEQGISQEFSSERVPEAMPSWSASPSQALDAPPEPDAVTAPEPFPDPEPFRDFEPPSPEGEPLQDPKPVSESVAFPGSERFPGSEPVPDPDPSPESEPLHDPEPIGVPGPFEARGALEEHGSSEKLASLPSPKDSDSFAEPELPLAAPGERSADYSSDPGTRPTEPERPGTRPTEPELPRTPADGA
jgi:DivIVA domain-containing protein